MTLTIAPSSELMCWNLHCLCSRMLALAPEDAIGTARYPALAKERPKPV